MVRNRKNTMTVGALVKKLSEMDPTMPVFMDIAEADRSFRILDVFTAKVDPNDGEYYETQNELDEAVKEEYLTEENAKKFKDGIILSEVI